MRLIRHLPALGFVLAILLAGPVCAQDAGREVVLSPENVRYDYAQVMAVRPVYQVLRTTSTERICEDRSADGSNALSRVVSAVKDKLGGDEAASASNCRTEQVPREYRRPIAYDVDYVYRGSKFRTRMARDPGNRLRIRVSITPHPIN